MSGKAIRLIWGALLIYLAIGLVLVSGQPVETLYIEESGVLRGFIFLPLSSEGVAEVNLPCSVPTVAVYPEKGVPTYTLNGSTLQIYGDPNTNVNVTFTCDLGNVSTISLTLQPINQTLNIYISQSYTVLGIYPTPEEISYKPGYVYLGFGNLSTSLQLELAETGLPGEGKPPVPSQATTPTTPPTTPTNVAPKEDYTLWIIVVALALAVIILGFLLARRNKKAPETLVEEDQSIIDYLKSMGGKAYLKEIREALGLPSTTALRRIKRLESMGVVKTEKTPGGLLVVLLRK
jgi:uncharacterized membrane protein